MAPHSETEEWRTAFAALVCVALTGAVLALTPGVGVGGGPAPGPGSGARHGAGTTATRPFDGASIHPLAAYAWADLHCGSSAPRLKSVANLTTDDLLRMTAAMDEAAMTHGQSDACSSARALAAAVTRPEPTQSPR